MVKAKQDNYAHYDEALSAGTEYWVRFTMKSPVTGKMIDVDMPTDRKITNAEAKDMIAQAIKTLREIDDERELTHTLLELAGKAPEVPYNRQLAYIGRQLKRIADRQSKE